MLAGSTGLSASHTVFLENPNRSPIQVFNRRYVYAEFVTVATCLERCNTQAITRSIPARSLGQGTNAIATVGAGARVRNVIRVTTRAFPRYR